MKKMENIVGGGTQILKGGRGRVTQFSGKLTSIQKSTLVILNHLMVFLKNMEGNCGRKKFLREAPQLLDQCPFMKHFESAERCHQSTSLY